MSRRNPSPDLWIFGGLLLVAAIVRGPALADAVQAKFASLETAAVADTSADTDRVAEVVPESTPAIDERVPLNDSASASENGIRPGERFTSSIGRGGYSSRCGGAPW